MILYSDIIPDVVEIVVVVRMGGQFDAVDRVGSFDGVSIRCRNHPTSSNMIQAGTLRSKIRS